jgi:hypothetical protein
MSATKRKLDLFQLLNGLSRKDFNSYKSLTDEEKKEVLPLIVMRWMSGTTDARQVMFLNELVNPHVFSIHKHKDLLVQLLTICGSGRSQRYTWSKAKTKKSNTPVAIDVIREYFGYNTSDATDAFHILTSSDIMDYAIQLGKQPDEITKLKKELKDK